MNFTSISRRNFLVTAIALGAAQSHTIEGLTASRADNTAAEEFLNQWEHAWNNHDAHQLCLLHTSDANTVNRFGTLVRGREALEKALGFLHGAGGPFHDVAAPPLQLIDLRQIAPNVMILQASWKSPVMNPDGKLDLRKQNDMIVSYTLLRDGGVWRATQVDLHNVDKMDLPFSNAGQKP
jgi:ketosteroid isomerase-like protein